MELNAGEKKRARRKAMLLLEHMDRTEKGLSDKLRQAGFSEEAAEDAIAYVKSYGYIDDHRYAYNYISYRIHAKSRQKIFQELTRRGVGREEAQSAWEEVEKLEEPDECALLRTMVERKYAEDAQLDEGELRRLYGFLARRGFQFADISRVLDEMHITRKSQDL